jgi:cell division protein FtsL
VRSSNNIIISSNYEYKNMLAIYGSFLFLVFFITSIIIFYISNNIILTELGYKLIELENTKVMLEEQNRKLDLNVETLSALDRIEEVASNHLGMIRPKEVKYIALNPTPQVSSREDIGVISNNYEKEKYFWASFNLNKLDDLILGLLK